MTWEIIYFFFKTHTHTHTIRGFIHYLPWYVRASLLQLYKTIKNVTLNVWHVTLIIMATHGTQTRKPVVIIIRNKPPMFLVLVVTKSTENFFLLLRSRHTARVHILRSRVKGVPVYILVRCSRDGQLTACVPFLRGPCYLLKYNIPKSNWKKNKYI